MDKQRYEYFRERGIINGCWWEWSFKFNSVIKHNIQFFEEFNASKLSKLLEDIELQCCWPHDIRYHNWNTLLNRVVADLIFSVWIYKLLSWTSWWNRAAVFMLVFFGLLKYGGKYFNYWERQYEKI